MNATLAACAAGALSPQVALARLVLAGALPPQGELDALGAAPGPLAALAALARPRRDRLAALGALAAAGLDPEGEGAGDDGVAATAALFNRLALAEPEAAVAFYSLGDPALLDAATAELMGVIRAWAPVAGARVLDLGCGIGRVAIPLAAEANHVTGLDVAPAMIAAARARAGGVANLDLLVGGRDLAMLGDGAVDLVLAVDSFPYLVRAGVQGAMLAEVARVLRPGGALLVFNWSYRGDPAADAAEARELGERHGLALERTGAPFAIWDAAAYRLRRR